MFVKLDKEIGRYKLTRDIITSVKFSIKEAGIINVKAPKNYPEHEIIRLLNERKEWIVSKYELIRKKNDKLEDLKDSMEDELLMMGTKYPLEIVEDYQYAFNFHENKFYIHADYIKNLNNIYETWLRRKAKYYIHNRLIDFMKLTGWSYRRFRITGAETRWGSCSSENNLNFTWKLMMAPKEVIDYLLVHELAHTVEHNHSKKFWQLVSSVDPNYKEHEKWLNENSYLVKL